MREFIRRLQMNRNEYEDVLERMRPRDGDAHAEGRIRPRYDYQVADIPMTIDHPEGGSSSFIVFGRNISRTGISVLHGGYVHGGSKCSVVLRPPQRRPLAVTGEVRHCRLVAGSCHEIGIRFDEEVDPGLLIGRDGEAELTEDDASRGGFLAIAGSLLVVEPFAPDRELLEHHLSLFDLEMVAAETAEAALEAIGRAVPDLVLFSLNLRDAAGISAVSSIRAAGYEGPLVLLTPEDDFDLIERAKTAGASGVIAKPYNLDFLIAQLQVHLSDAAPLDEIYSTATDQPGMPALIRQYVTLVRRLADQIERTCGEGEWTQLREYCCQLKGSGCSHGFQVLTVAAVAALNALDAGAVEAGDHRAVDELVRCCRLLAVQDRTQAA